MKRFTVGDTWKGNSHADMINKVLGTNYKAYMKSYVPLSKFGKAPNAIAWFVFMDGNEHGTSKDKWANKLSGTEIHEKYSGNVAHVRYGLGYDGLTERLAFQLDPDGKGDRYKCKFVGYFKLAKIDEIDEKRAIKIYERTSYTYTL